MTPHVTPDELDLAQTLLCQRRAAILAGDSATISEIDHQLDRLQEAHITRVCDRLLTVQAPINLTDEAYFRQVALDQAREQWFFTYNARKPVVGMCAAQREASAEYDAVLIDHGFDPVEFDKEGTDA